MLQQVPNMCDLLGLKRLTPKRLVWRDSVGMGRGTMPVPVDYPLISGKQLTLALRAREFLTAEQWKPLLGSSLLVNSRAKPRAIRTAVVGVLAALAYYVPVLFLVFGTNLLGNNLQFFGHPIFPVVFFVIAVILYDRVYSPEAHKDALRADLQVVGLLGTELFLDALQRIDSMGFREVQELERRPSRYKQPSIQERIRNLQTGGTTPA